MSDKKAQSTLNLKVKFERNSATLDVTNSSLETVIFKCDYKWLDRENERRNMSYKEISKIYRFRKIMSVRIRKKKK